MITFDKTEGYYEKQYSHSGLGDARNPDSNRDIDRVRDNPGRGKIS
jgi:hypothetical protein